MTILDYLAGLCSYPIPTDTLAAIARRRGLDPDATLDAAATEGRAYVLARADVYWWLSTAPTVSQGGQSYSPSEGDKERFRRTARASYGFYGEEAPGGGPKYGYRGEFL